MVFSFDGVPATIFTETLHSIFIPSSLQEPRKVDEQPTTLYRIWYLSGSSNRPYEAQPESS